MRIEKWKKSGFWALWDGPYLVCITVYRKGAVEVMRRLSA